MQPHALVFVVLASVLVTLLVATNAGEPCLHVASGQAGQCRPLPRCPAAVRERQQGRWPQHCGFPNNSPVPDVCCPRQSDAPVQAAPPAAPPGQPSRPSPLISVSSCAAFNASIMQLDKEAGAAQPGSTARRMCLQYQRHICAGPGKKPDTPFGAYAPPQAFDPADLLEFPHMALLGFGEKDAIVYSCGGSLISSTFVLTAAHCVSNKESPVRWVLLGALNRTQTLADASTRQLVEVAQIIVHPEYRVNLLYHDVALLRLASPAVMGKQDVRPACLQTDVDDQDLGVNGTLGQLALATGWGATETAGDGSEQLLKGRVAVRPLADCEPVANEKVLPRGLDAKAHVCAGGDGEQPTDACNGDSGGPLQFPIQGRPEGALYRVMAVVSFGGPCGIGLPGVYARVSTYVPWIESIVWPRGGGEDGVCFPDSGPGTVARRACLFYQSNYSEMATSRSAMPGITAAQRCHFRNDATRFEKAEVGEFPHQVQVMHHGHDQQGCAGTLISPRFVLTAAHCVRRDCAGSVHFVAARFKWPARDNGGRYLYVEEAVVHPQFDAATRRNDVALLRLKQDVYLDWMVRPACLDTERDLPAKLLASGFTAEGLWTNTYGDLQKVQVDNTPCKVSSRAGQGAARQGADSLCVRAKSGGAVPGEAGAPLQLLERELDGQRVYRVAGVLSRPADCGSPRPDVYTRVAPFVPWIESVVWPAAKTAVRRGR